MINTYTSTFTDVLDVLVFFFFLLGSITEKIIVFKFIFGMGELGFLDIYKVILGTEASASSKFSLSYRHWARVRAHWFLHYLSVYSFTPAENLTDLSYLPKIYQVFFFETSFYTQNDYQKFLSYL